MFKWALLGVAALWVLNNKKSDSSTGKTNSGKTNSAAGDAPGVVPAPMGTVAKAYLTEPGGLPPVVALYPGQIVESSIKSDIDGWKYWNTFDKRSGYRQWFGLHPSLGTVKLGDGVVELSPHSPVGYVIDSTVNNKN